MIDEGDRECAEVEEKEKETVRTIPTIPGFWSAHSCLEEVENTQFD